MIKFINLLLNSVNGTSIYASGYKFKENGDGTTVTYTGSNVTAKDTLNIESGADTNIIGSKATGENINLTAKGNVNITAKENISTFNSKDKKSGSEIGVSFSVNGMSVYGNAYNI